MAKQKLWRRRGRPGTASYDTRVCPRCGRKVLMTIRVMNKTRDEYWDCSRCGRTTRFSF